MPMSADVYMCKVCDSMIKIINGSEVPPVCCETDMEIVTDEIQLKHIPDDKNVCGAVFTCQKCNFKAIIVNDQGTVPRHCMEDMKMTADRTAGEWDQIGGHHRRGGCRGLRWTAQFASFSISAFCLRAWSAKELSGNSAMTLS